MRLYSKMSDNTKQVRVDNWGIFFLQRLQMFFSKTDYCDMTLQFEGNVQLKVHRLVMNACTEYFQFLEQTCTIVEDNVIMMPADLQADVIVPIVNFMYTGMLEFHLSIYDKLYKTAELMNITILTKLLDAQKQPSTTLSPKLLTKKAYQNQNTYNLQGKKIAAKTSHHLDLPATLPGRKLPVWKRKSAPSPSPSFSNAISHSYYSDPKRFSATDPLSITDNTPKPTRFEWPEDDLPAMNMMDTSFEEISYTSKPLLTQEEELRASTSFDDLKQQPNVNRSVTSTKKTTSPSLDMEEMKNYVKEQKIRSGLTSSNDDEIIETDLDSYNYNDANSSTKRKSDTKTKVASKKVRFDEQENKGPTINVALDAKNSSDFNHTKIVSEILKKYPQLVKKNKNIRLKIMATNKTGTTTAEATKVENIQIRSSSKASESATKSNKTASSKSSEDKSPWICEKCSTDGEQVEFVLYYLYRKHLTDVHNEKFDPKLCKYCGHRCSKQNLLMYHLYTKHGMKPPPNCNFPKCDQCPFIASSDLILAKHKLRHDKNEIQCVECNLAFTSQATLTTHVQITGHTGKSNKNNYDCQYCTKRYQSSINLFCHVRSQHYNEAIRDGIVSIDETDDIEESEEQENNSRDEYILPEIISDTPKEKVKILSNVKMTSNKDQLLQQTQRNLSLEPSSEAEALSNVASGIATSLGLVDIVVLDENQQFVLQSNQQHFENEQGEQPEFILPELAEGETYNQDHSEVISQGMISTGDISSTDELVMVLTDHDYGDNQEEINNENSNIVVLYSHPVDGQQDQFITSQGNIMLNSQTGIIEIRNGASITTTTTSNQMVLNNSQDTHIESIEMIQREIESHRDLKQESLYGDERKSTILQTEQENEETNAEKSKEESNQEQQEQEQQSVTERDSRLLNVNFTEEQFSAETNRYLECSKEVDDNNTVVDSVNDSSSALDLEPDIVPRSTESNEDQEMTSENQVYIENTSTETEQVEGNLIDNSADKSQISEEIEKSAVKQIEEEAEVVERSPSPVELSNEKCELVESVVTQLDNNSMSDNNRMSTTTTTGNNELSDIAVDVNDESSPIFVPETNKTDEDFSVNENNTELEANAPEETIPMEEPPVDEISTVKENEENKIVEEDNIPVEDMPVEDKTMEEEPMETENSFTEEIPTKSSEQTGPVVEEPSHEQDISQSSMEVIEVIENQEEGIPSETSTSQFNDENSQSSQASQEIDDEKKEGRKINHTTKISILDDWDDTDSQQSAHKLDDVKDAGEETVNKLMDDWEDEEEDDGGNKESNE